MTLLAPWALWFSIVGAAIVALYVLKIKRRQHTVPALDFWRELARRTKVHSLFQRLKRLLSMLLWIVIAACLVLALGNPILSLGRIKPRAIAVIIDNSASMQAIEVARESKTRLQLAREALGELTTRRPVQDEWLLIEAAREPVVRQAWTHDPKAVRQAADDLQPFNGTGDLPAAVDLADQLLMGKAEPCIIIISDGAGDTLQRLTQRDQRIVHWLVGQTQDNLGIARLSVRLHRQLSAHHVLVSVVNAAKEKIETQIAFQIDGVTSAVELMSIEPQSTWEKTVVIDAPGGGVLRASIDRPDALALDNEAFAILQPIHPAVVWLVTPPNEAFFFEQALASMDPLVWTEQSLTMSIDQYELASMASPADLKAADLVIFNNGAPKQLPKVGRFVMINALPREIGELEAAAITAPQMFIAPRAHPITQYLNLQGVRLAKASRIALSDRATVLAQSADTDPLIVLCEQGDRQMLCLAFDVLDSDMPFRNAFPLLLRNVVAYLHAERPALIKPQYLIGETIEPLRPLASAVREVKFTVLRDGQTTDSAAAVRDSRFAWTDTSRNGALRATIDDKESCYAAINLADAGESRLGPWPAASDPEQALGLSGRVFGAMPWIGFAAAAAALIALEWLTYNFRWTE